MNIQQLEYFLAVAKFLNFTRAAEKYYISQTAITQQIKSLEEQLGVKLFNRTKRHVELTQAGIVFIEEAKNIINVMKEAVNRTQATATGFLGDLNVGFIKGYEHSTFPEKIIFFKSFNKNINLSLKRKDPIPLYENLEQNKYDIVFNFDFAGDNYPNFEKRFIERIPLVAVLYKDHPLAHRKFLLREELKDESFVLNRINSLKNDGTEKILDNYIKSGFFPNIVYKSSDIETMLIMIATGAGISILPEYTKQMLNSLSNLVFIPLLGQNEYIDIFAFWKKGSKDIIIEKLLNLF